MEKLIGRPPDKCTQGLRCPQCHNKALRKAGFRHSYSKRGVRKLQAYLCGLCHFQTTKPLRDEG